MGIIDNIASALLARGVSSFKDSMRRNFMPSTFQGGSGDAGLFGGIRNMFYGQPTSSPTLSSFDEVVPIKEAILNKNEYKPERIRPDDMVRSLDRVHSGIANYLTQINRNTIEIFRYVKDYSKQQDLRFTNIQKDSIQLRRTQSEITERLQKVDYRLKTLESQGAQKETVVKDTATKPTASFTGKGFGLLSMFTKGEVAVAGAVVAGGAVAAVSTARAAIQGLVRAGAAMMRGGAKGGLIGGSIAILQMLNSEKVKDEVRELLKKQDNFSDDEVAEFFKLSIEDQGKALDALGYKPAEIEQTAREVRQDHVKKRNERKDQKWNENLQKFWDSNSNNREERQNYKKERDERKDKSWRDKWDKFWNKSSNDEEPQQQKGSKAGPMIGTAPQYLAASFYSYFKQNDENLDQANSGETTTVDVKRGTISIESRLGDFNLTSRRDIVAKSDERIILNAKEIIFDAPSIVFKTAPKSGNQEKSHTEFEEPKRAPIKRPEDAPTIATPDNMRPFTIDEVQGSVFGEKGERSSMGQRPRREGAPLGGGTKRSPAQMREPEPQSFGPPTTSFSQSQSSQTPSFSQGPTTSSEAPWVKSMKQSGGTDGGIDRSQFQNEWQNERLLREMAVLTKNEVGLSNTNRAQAFMETLHNRAWNEKASLQSRIRNTYYPGTFKGEVTDEEFEHFKQNILKPVQAGSNVSAVNGIPSTHNASGGVAERTRQKGGGWKYMGEETIGHKPHERANLENMPRLKSLTGGVTEGNPNFALTDTKKVERAVRGFEQVGTNPNENPNLSPSMFDPNVTRLPNVNRGSSGPIGQSQGKDGRYPADTERLFHKGGQLSGVDPKLMHILKEASKDLPEGYRAEVISGKDGRSTGTTNHPGGIAVDLQIYDKEGNLVPYNKNSEGWKNYEQMYQSVVERGKVLYPKEDWIWGGAWISSAAGRGDPMHFQRLDKSVGGSSSSSGRYDPEKGLDPNHPFTNEFGGKSHMDREELAAYKSGVREKAKSEYNQPSAKITIPNVTPRQLDQEETPALDNKGEAAKEILPGEVAPLEKPPEAKGGRLMNDIFGQDKWQSSESSTDRAKRLMEQWRQRNPQLMPRSDQSTPQSQQIEQLRSEQKQQETNEAPPPKIIADDKEMKQLEKRISADDSTAEKKMLSTKHDPEQEASRPGSPEGRGGEVPDPDAIDLQ